MSFRKLYEYCQTFENRHIKRTDLISKACEIKAIDSVPVVFEGFNESLVRGLFFVPTDNHRAWLPAGTPCILVARGMGREWTRFVTAKEVMHLFDSDLASVSTPVEFSSLLEELAAPAQSSDASAALRSEHDALYMALACLCPEKRRRGYVGSVQRGEMTIEMIAGELRIPFEAAYFLLRPDFKQIIERCLARYC